MPESRIRPAVAADLPALTEIYNHYIRHTPITFDLEPFSVEGRRKWFDQFAGASPYRLLVAAEEGAVLGFATSSPFRPKPAYRTTVETSVYCAPDHTGQGLGFRLYSALFDALRGEELHQALALIPCPNEPSEKLHRRCGFTLVGVMPEVGYKFDRYWDVALYEKRLA